MKSLFENILDLEDVESILLITFEGEVIHKDSNHSTPMAPQQQSWWAGFVTSLKGIREADLV